MNKRVRFRIAGSQDDFLVGAIDDLRVGEYEIIIESVPDTTADFLIQGSKASVTFDACLALVSALKEHGQIITAIKIIW
jgi:hypothetical protein